MKKGKEKVESLKGQKDKKDMEAKMVKDGQKNASKDTGNAKDGGSGKKAMEDRREELRKRRDC